MSNPFFITGLPRSRTTWLANLLTFGEVFCHHDLIGCVHSLHEFECEMSRENVGDSDSGLMSISRSVVETWPGARWLMVMRDREDAWRALEKYVAVCGIPRLEYDTRDRIEEWQDKTCALLKGNPNAIFVDFDSLGDMNTLREIWEFLTPQTPFSFRRCLQQMSYKVEPVPCRFNLEIHPNVIKEILELSRKP
jgi:hypothetical protein